MQLHTQLHLVQNHIQGLHTMDKGLLQEDYVGHHRKAGDSSTEKCTVIDI